MALALISFTDDTMRLSTILFVILTIMLVRGEDQFREVLTALADR